MSKDEKEKAGRSANPAGPLDKFEPGGEWPARSKTGTRTNSGLSSLPAGATGAGAGRTPRALPISASTSPSRRMDVPASDCRWSELGVLSRLRSVGVAFALMQGHQPRADGVAPQ